MLATLLVLSLFGQSSTITVPLWSFGSRVYPIPVDTDGDPDTHELALYQYGREPKWRVAALRNEAWCLGDWFAITPTPEGDQGAIVRVGRTDWLRWLDPGLDSMRLTRLDTPPCVADAQHPK